MTVDGGRGQVIKLEPRPVVTPGGRSPFVATPVWVHERFRAGEISTTGLAVYASLATFANAARRAHPSQPALAARAGVSGRTVRRGLAELRAAECIGVGRRGQGRSNLYLLPWNDPRGLSTGDELDRPKMAHQPPPPDFDRPNMAHLERPNMAYRTRTNELRPPVLNVTAQSSGHAREPIQSPLMYAQPDQVQSDALTRGSPPNKDATSSRHGPEGTPPNAVD